VEEIVVTIPRAKPFGAVAGLVLGGVAARHELTIEVLDDLQLALETLLGRDAGEGSVSIELRVGGGTVDASVGPFARDAVAELERGDDSTLGLHRLLTTVVDEVRLADRDGDVWVDLRKDYVEAQAA